MIVLSTMERLILQAAAATPYDATSTVALRACKRLLAEGLLRHVDGRFVATPLGRNRSATS
jgi:hypothetical protein